MIWKSGEMVTESGKLVQFGEAFEMNDSIRVRCVNRSEIGYWLVYDRTGHPADNMKEGVERIIHRPPAAPPAACEPMDIVERARDLGRSIDETGRVDPEKLKLFLLAFCTDETIRRAEHSAQRKAAGELVEAAKVYRKKTENAPWYSKEGVAMVDAVAADADCRSGGAK